ncbi:hypothetical protein B9Z51_17010 [Limnohabitans sp. T6-5]|nr:hypothetical protein B9Z51_17010 [Limnohabitans sp. T6-5]
MGGPAVPDMEDEPTVPEMGLLGMPADVGVFDRRPTAQGCGVLVGRHSKSPTWAGGLAVPDMEDEPTVPEMGLIGMPADVGVFDRRPTAQGCGVLVGRHSKSPTWAGGLAVPDMEDEPTVPDMGLFGMPADVGVFDRRPTAQGCGLLVGRHSKSPTWVGGPAVPDMEDEPTVPDMEDEPAMPDMGLIGMPADVGVFDRRPTAQGCGVLVGRHSKSPTWAGGLAVPDMEDEPTVPDMGLFGMPADVGVFDRRPTAQGCGLFVGRHSKSPTWVGGPAVPDMEDEPTVPEMGLLGMPADVGVFDRRPTAQGCGVLVGRHSKSPTWAGGPAVPDMEDEPAVPEMGLIGMPADVGVFDRRPTAQGCGLLVGRHSKSPTWVGAPAMPGMEGEPTVPD